MNKMLLAGVTLATAALAQTAANPTFPGTDLNRSVTLQASLSSQNENPPVTARPASGTAMLAIRLDRASTSNAAASAANVQVTINATTTMNESVTAAHIHRGRAGANGPVVLDFQIGQTAISTIANQPAAIHQQLNVTNADQLKVLEEVVANPAAFYVNVHTQSTPDGHIRGQLMASADDRLNLLDSRISSADADLIEIRRMLVALSFKAGVITSEERDAQNAALDRRANQGN